MFTSNYRHGQDTLILSVTLIMQRFVIRRIIATFDPGQQKILTKKFAEEISRPKLTSEMCAQEFSAQMSKKYNW